MITGAAPVDVTVKFSKSNPTYTVDVTPPSTQYLGKSTNVTQATFSALPLFQGENHHVLDVRLEEKLFTVLNYIEVVLDSRRTWRGAVV